MGIPKLTLLPKRQLVDLCMLSVDYIEVVLIALNLKTDGGQYV